MNTAGRLAVFSSSGLTGSPGFSSFTLLAHKNAHAGGCAGCFGAAFQYIRAVAWVATDAVIEACGSRLGRKRLAGECLSILCVFNKLCILTQNGTDLRPELRELGPESTQLRPRDGAKQDVLSHANPAVKLRALARRRVPGKHPPTPESCNESEQIVRNRARQTGRLVLCQCLLLGWPVGERSSKPRGASFAHAPSSLGHPIR